MTVGGDVPVAGDFDAVAFAGEVVLHVHGNADVGPGGGEFDAGRAGVERTQVVVDVGEGRDVDRDRLAGLGAITDLIGEELFRFQAGVAARIGGDREARSRV